MKKTYIAPALKNHKIAIEAEILTVSAIATFGNRKRWDSTAAKYDGYEVPYVEDEGYAIDVIEGDDWSTL